MVNAIRSGIKNILDFSAKNGTALAAAATLAGIASIYLHYRYKDFLTPANASPNLGSVGAHAVLKSKKPEVRPDAILSAKQELRKAIHLGGRIQRGARQLSNFKVIPVLESNRHIKNQILIEWEKKIFAQPVITSHLRDCLSITQSLIQSTKEMIPNFNRIFAVSNEQGSIQAVISLSEMLFEGKIDWHVNYLCASPDQIIAPTKRNKGAGTRALIKACEMAAYYNSASIRLYPLAGAAPFYLSLGFERQGGNFVLPRDKFFSLLSKLPDQSRPYSQIQARL